MLNSNNISLIKGPILITGASGFIGANLLKILYKERQDVYGTMHSGDDWRLSGFPNENLHLMDINNTASVKMVITKVKPKTVFHCAVYGAYSFEADEKKIYQTNFIGTSNLIKLLIEYKVEAFINAGSSSEYGENCSGPSETSFCLPDSEYSVSKNAVSNLLRFYGRRKNFPCVNLRLYSVYGPYEDPRRLFPAILKNGLSKKLPPFVNENTSRDFVYIEDVCAAFILAAIKMHPDLYGIDINIGSGKATRIKDLAQIVTDEFEILSEPIFDSMPPRRWDLQNWFGQINLAKEKLNWQPDTDLKQGLKKIRNWWTSSDYCEPIINTLNQPDKKSISAIIACYKDVEAIPIMYSRLINIFEKLKIDYEIIFVNDGSPDNSLEVIREITVDDLKVVGINHSRNFGSQMAFRSGMEIMSKDAAVLLDGDLQDPPELIEEFYKKWRQGYSIVYGERVKRDASFFMQICYKIFYRVFARFSYIKIPLDAGDFSLIDKHVVKCMLSSTERDLFIRGLRAYVGFPQIGVPYVRPERMFGVSTNSFAKNIEWAKKGIFSYSNTPVTFLTTFGSLLLLFSLIIILLMGVLRLMYPEIAPKGATSILMAIFFFGSLNVFAVGMIGEYILKILVEVKGRPRLIRESIIRSGVLEKNNPLN